MFQVEILLPFWREHLVTHVTLLLSLFDEVRHFAGLDFVDVCRYVPPRAADGSASLAANQARAAAFVIAVPMFHQFSRRLDLQSAEPALQSPLVRQWFWYCAASLQCLGDRTQEAFHAVSHVCKWKGVHPVVLRSGTNTQSRKMCSGKFIIPPPKGPLVDPTEPVQIMWDLNFSWQWILRSQSPGMWCRRNTTNVPVASSSYPEDGSNRVIQNICIFHLKHLWVYILPWIGNLMRKKTPCVQWDVLCSGSDSRCM